MRPLVSVVVANHNGAAFLADALRSTLAQSLASFDVHLVDDASTDSSLAVAAGFAADPRLHIHRLPRNLGPAAARNHGLAAARGEWIAVVDADDIIHPQRLERLVAVARADAADIVADDLLLFEQNRLAPPHRLLRGRLAAAPSWISAVQYASANRLGSGTVALGYLKPMFRASLLSQFHLAYAEDLRVAEDFDLILRMLARGARFRLVPELLYFYRRHGASLSHRLPPQALASMVLADARFRSWAGPHAVAPLRRALDARLASIHTAMATEAAIAALKARTPLAALRAVAGRPAALPALARLASPLRLARRLWPATPAAPMAQPSICVLSRQRLTPGANGSSAYLLSLCAALRQAGFTLRLVCPSPGVMGRVPLLRVAGEGSVFERVAIRGTWRLGSLRLARDPLVYLRAALGVADRMARRIGITALGRLAHPAPYAVALPWSAADYLFVAAEAGGQADVVLADYAFLTPGIPYALRPGATTAVVMHDLFSARPAAFAALGATDSVAALAPAEEARLLAGAGLVIAIQAEEAQAARHMLPAGSAVLVAPMAMASVAAPQAGEGAGLLFVGSDTAPNVDGLGWFLAQVWPSIRAIRPDARLSVAGTVCRALPPGPWPGVALLGRVAELAPLYRQADVVIAPLRAGSGLKVKLVEALAHGKPLVATSVAAQGVEALLDGAVALADTAPAFATAVLHLMADPALRAHHAAAALAVAQHSFSASAAYAGVIRHLRGPLATPHQHLQAGAAACPA